MPKDGGKIRVRWLGNSCVEIFGDRHILIDPNAVVDWEEEPDIVLVTHEHGDHFARQDYEKFKDAGMYAPAPTLEKLGVEGQAVSAGDSIGEIQVLESHCWKADKSVSYFYRGVLHSGDTAQFPSPEQDIELLFSACFPDLYDDYVTEFNRLEPDMVVPFHYDPRNGAEDASGLKKRLGEEGIASRVLMAGESVYL